MTCKVYNGPFAFDVTHEFWGGNFKNGITSPSSLLHAFHLKFLLRSKLPHVSFLLYFTMELSKGFFMQRNIAEVANETREIAFFDFWGGNFR